MNYLRNFMKTNSDGHLSKIATISVSLFGIVAISYCWHFGIVLEINRILELLDHLVQSPLLNTIVLSIETLRELIEGSSPRG
jgi:hypothetical protein